MGTYSSVTRMGAYEPFELQVARGQVDGHSVVQIFGYSTTVGSSALGPLWEGLTPSGGAYVYPSVAAPLVLVSDSASDNTTRSVVITGCGANFAPLTETIALNGTSNVTTVNSFLRINNMSMLNSTNTGNITASISSTVYAKISAGIGQTQMSIYTVPAGYTFYLSYVQSDSNIGFTSSAYLKYAEFNKFASGFQTLTDQSTFVQNLNLPYTAPIAHPEKTDIQFQFVASTGSNTIADCYAGGILIKNPD